MNEYDITTAFKVIENELIASMIRNMDHHRAEETKEGYEWSMWQAEQLKALEKYKRDNQKKYKKQFQKINGEIDLLIRQARETGNMQQEIKILEAIKKGFPAQKIGKGMTAEFFHLNDRKLEALIEATTHDMERAETAILRKAEDDYRKAIYNAQVYANTGAGTYEMAVDMATKDMLSRGLNCVQYINGARHTLADYADMAIRTASKRAYLQGEGEKRKEWGIATVIVNKRGNPCPKCLPFCGKVLIDDVWSGGSEDGVDPESGKKCPLMSYAISQGLYHPRCRDSHTTYFPGISTADDTWTKEELEAIGQEYEAEQKQQYAKRQEEKFGRLAEYSLDSENQKRYAARREEWKKQAEVDGLFEAKKTAMMLGISEDKVEFDEIDVKLRKSVYNGINKVFKKFPQLKGFTKSIQYNPDLDAIAASKSLSGELILSADFKDYERLKKKYDRAVKMKEFPKGTTVDSVIVHEMGHQLDGFLTIKGICGGQIGIYGTIRTSVAVEKEVLKELGYYEYIREERAMWRNMGYKGRELNDALAFSRKEFITAHISEYANENSNEFFAECFSEYMTSKTPRKAAKIFEKVLERAIGELE